MISHDICLSLTYFNKCTVFNYCYFRRVGYAHYECEHEVTLEASLQLSKDAGSVCATAQAPPLQSPFCALPDKTVEQSS